ncbi:MAG: hypothetical protein FWE01_02775 [Firmicutes bacterium]|nr:hypothetical protein [Bacillota bacterium]
MEEIKNKDDAKKMLRVAFRAMTLVIEKLGGEIVPGPDLDKRIAEIKQEVLYSPQVVDALMDAGLDEQSAGELIDNTMNEVITEYFKAKADKK